MTPKEKAVQLYKQYVTTLNIADMRQGANPFAKQCALIAVDEILSLCWNGNEVAKKYWLEVKQEIEKL